MSNYTILVADQDTKMLEEIEAILQDVDINHPIKVTDGLTALNVFKENKIDISFIEFNLPEINGIDLLKQMKEFNEGAFVVMLGKEPSDNNMEDAKREGAIRILRKPFKPYHIIKMIYLFESWKIGE